MAESTEEFRDRLNTLVKSAAAGDSDAVAQTSDD